MKFFALNYFHSSIFEPFILYYSAVNYSTEYYWRINVNDSVQELNETYLFTPVLSGGQVVGGINGAIMALAASGVLFAILALFWHRRRRGGY